MTFQSCFCQSLIYFQKLDIAGVCQYLWHPGHCSGPVRNGSSPELHWVLTPAWFLGELSALRQRLNIVVLPKDGLSQITWAQFTRGTKWPLQIKALPLLFSEKSNTGHLKNLESQQLFPRVSLWISLHYTFPGLITFIIQRLLLRMEDGFTTCLWGRPKSLAKSH